MALELCKTIADYPGSNGALPMLYAIRDCVPMAFEGLLLLIFFVLFAGNYFLITSKTGRQKIFVALLASSFAMVVLSSLLALTQLVTFMTVILYAFICIVAFILFLISDNS